MRITQNKGITNFSFSKHSVFNTSEKRANWFIRGVVGWVSDRRGSAVCYWPTNRI